MTTLERFVLLAASQATQLVHALVVPCPPIDDAVLAMVATAVASQAAAQAGSSRFGTLLLHLLNKYSLGLAPHKLKLELAVAANTTFIKRALEAALGRL